jgi:hypothetical protein
VYSAVNQAGGLGGPAASATGSTDLTAAEYATDLGFILGP